MMEYVIVLVFIGATLALTSARLFYGPADSTTGRDARVNPAGFGEMGLQFVGFFQRVMGGLSLPVP